MLHAMPTWLKNSVLLAVLFLLMLWMQDAASAYMRSVVGLIEALGRLNVPPRDGSPFVVPASGPVLVDGRMVKCPFTGSHFVWMGAARSGEQVVVTREGGSDYRVFAGSAKPNSNGVRLFAIAGIREHDPGIRIWP